MEEINDAVQERRRVVADAVIETVERWLGSDSGATAVRERVETLLNHDIDDVVMKVIGFRRRSFDAGKWELDHCNGRSGNSIVGERLHRTAEKKAEEWMKRVMGDALEVDLTKEERDDLREEYLKMIRRAVRAEMSSRARDVAVGILNEMEDEVIGSVLRAELGVSPSKEDRND